MTDNVLARYYNGRNVLSQGPPASGYDKLADLVSSATGFHRQGTTTNALARGLDLATLGMMTGAYDGGREIADTGRPGSLAMALMPGAKVARPAVEAAETVTRQGIRAFHGSPHDFDRFDMSKIGTGEGAQAYGHGLYFAEAEDVAKYYRDTLPTPKTASQSHSEAWVKKHGGRLEALKATENGVAEMRARAAQLRSEAAAAMASKQYHIYARKSGAAETLDDHIRAFDLLSDPSWAPVRSNGRMYEVNIKASPDEFLDWDKPLSEQSESVRRLGDEVIANPGRGAGFVADANKFPVTGQSLYQALAARAGDRSNSESAKAAAVLREAGVPGVRYLDKGSRAAGEGSRNYTVFDDALIEIMRKYGLLPPLAAGGLGAVSQSDPAMASP